MEIKIIYMFWGTAWDNLEQGLQVFLYLSCPCSHTNATSNLISVQSKLLSKAYNFIKHMYQCRLLRIEGCFVSSQGQYTVWSNDTFSGSKQLWHEKVYVYGFLML